MSAITFRHYLPGDEPGIVSLWNRCLTWDPVTELRFRKLVLLDPNFDPHGMRIAVRGGSVVGVFYSIRRRLPMLGTELESDKGWVPFFFVDPDCRREGVATRLLEDAMAFMRANKRETLLFSGYAPNYIVPGIDRSGYPAGAAFLDKVGFQRNYTAVAMDYNLVPFDIPEDVRQLKKQRISEGYSFATAADRDLYELIQFATDHFNSDWGRAIREGLLQNLTMQQILVARHHGELVGFCLHGGYEGVRERFGPFGVDSGQRGKGIGKILLYDCLHLMRSQGMHGAWFLWTGEQSAAGQLYKKLGFNISRSFDVVSRSL